MTRLCSGFAEARSLSVGTVGLVPTMGFFHEGHLSLMERARTECDTVVVSVFVNPLQFDRADDLAAYPRDLGRDLALAREVPVDIVVAPPYEEVYPVEALTRVGVDRLTDHLEGPRRPGHFEGVTTVVAKLFAGLTPHRAYFGRKDAQQLSVVTRMAQELRFPVEVVGCPVVREADGLALSSRNVRLSPEDRQIAAALSHALFAAADVADSGETETAVLERRAREAVGAIDVEYLELVDAAEVQPLDRLSPPAFLAIAARVGQVRLIDSLWFDASEAGPVSDRGVRLDEPSILYR